MSLKNNKLSDEKLFDLIQEGNRVAFTQLYNKYAKMVYVLSYRYLKDVNMSQDIVQQVFVKFWECRYGIAISSSVRNYIYTMAKNDILNKIKKNKNIIMLNYEEAQAINESFEESYDEIIEKRETTSALYNALDLLPKRNREVCILKIEEKMTNQQVADTLNISVSAVKANYVQAIVLLRRHMKRVFSIIIFFLSIV